MACEVPLEEQLLSIPKDARLVWTELDGLKATHFVPIGILAHKAATALLALRSASPAQANEPPRCGNSGLLRNDHDASRYVPCYGCEDCRLSPPSSPAGRGEEARWTPEMIQQRDVDAAEMLAKMRPKPEASVCDFIEPKDRAEAQAMASAVVAEASVTGPRSGVCETCGGSGRIDLDTMGDECPTCTTRAAAKEREQRCPHGVSHLNRCSTCD